MRTFLLPILVLGVMLVAAPPRQAHAQKTTDTTKITTLKAATPLTAATGSTATTTSASGSKSTLFPSMKGLPGSGTNATTGGNSRTAAGRDSSTTKPLLGSEWRIQRSHERGSFVGADSTDDTGFIGSEQAMEEGEGQIISAVEGLRLGSNATVNLPLPVRRKTDIYDPVIEIDFAVTRPALAAVSSELTQRLGATVSLRLLSPIEVSVEGRTATLRGAVASERDRALAERLLLFEPGIDGVRNQLQVKTPSQAPQRP